MVAVLEVAPFMVKISGTADPGVTPEGICTLTWYSPTKPGAKPEKVTLAASPPMVTVGVSMVVELPPASAPDFGWFRTAPSPLQKMLMNPPRGTGEAFLPGIDPVGAAKVSVLAMRIAPWPAALTTKIPGEAGPTVMV